MNLRPAPQDLAAWLPDALEVMDRNARVPTESRLIPTEDPELWGKPWTEFDDLALINLVNNNLRRNVIAFRMKRSLRAVNTRLTILRKEGSL